MQVYNIGVCKISLKCNVITRPVNCYPGTRVPAGNSSAWVMKNLPWYPFKTLNNSTLKAENMLHLTNGDQGTHWVLVSGYPGSKMCTCNSSSDYPWVNRSLEHMLIYLWPWPSLQITGLHYNKASSYCNNMTFSWLIFSAVCLTTIMRQIVLCNLIVLHKKVANTLVTKNLGKLKFVKLKTQTSHIDCFWWP